MTFDPRPARPRRFSLVLLLAVGISVAILVGLGTWQMQRRVWKEALLARIEALKAAPAEPLQVVLRRLPDQVDIEYVRAQTACPNLETLPTIRLYSVRGGMSGYRLIAACPVDAGPYATILVDRGFIPREVVDTPATPVALERPIVGILRKGDAGGATAAAFLGTLLSSPPAAVTAAATIIAASGGRGKSESLATGTAAA